MHARACYASASTVERSDDLKTEVEVVAVGAIRRRRRDRDVVERAFELGEAAPAGRVGARAARIGTDASRRSAPNRTAPSSPRHSEGRARANGIAAPRQRKDPERAKDKQAKAPDVGAGTGTGGACCSPIAGRRAPCKIPGLPMQAVRRMASVLPRRTTRLTRWPKSAAWLSVLQNRTGWG